MGFSQCNLGIQNKSEPKVSAPLYIVMRGNNTTPERFHADDDIDARQRLQREVRAGQNSIVYLYKLLCAEKFVPSSENIPVDKLMQNTTLDPVEKLLRETLYRVTEHE